MTGSLKDWAMPLELVKAFSVSEHDGCDIVVTLEGGDPEEPGPLVDSELLRVDEPGKYVLVRVED